MTERMATGTMENLKKEGRKKQIDNERNVHTEP